MPQTTFNVQEMYVVDDHVVISPWEEFDEVDEVNRFVSQERREIMDCYSYTPNLLILFFVELLVDNNTRGFSVL